MPLNIIIWTYGGIGFLPPIACLSLLIMAVTFLAISLEKVLDPRLKEIVGA